MSYKQRFKQILRAKGKLLALLLTFSLFSSVAPGAALFAQMPAMNLNAAAPMQDATSMDAAVACDNFRTLAVNDTLELSMLRRSMESAWIKFTVQQNARYRMEVNNAAGLQLELYDRCNANAPAVELRNGQLEFTATRDGDYYLLVKHDGVASVSGYQVTLSPAAPHRPSFTPLVDVPEAVLRRATEFLEEIRGGDLAPEWQDARVNPEARILYRPDIQEPAYYEFTVEKPVDNGWGPAGFIQLAAGDHDYPVTHWDVTGMSPTQELAEIAPLGAELTEFYKLDTLAYVAEYEELTPIGVTTVTTDVINIGDLPGRIEGLDAIPQEPAELVTESIDSEGNVVREGPEELPLTEMSDWDSWATLKAEFEEEYGPLLASLKQRASDAWELEENLSQHGESLIKGDVRTVHGLASQTISAIDVTGDGAAPQYLQQELLRDNGRLAGVKLTVLDEPTDMTTRLTFEVALHYTSGTTETIKYAIVNARALNINQVYLPLISSSSSDNLVNLAGAEKIEATLGSWGPWHYFWADDAAGSIRYGQIPKHTSVNTSSCASGCGPTSWAMLFAWVDRLAATGHAKWGPHWGLYRVNGGLGTNAVAPLTQDAGARNMTWEIRNHVGTWCIFGSGATWPWRMIDASKYVRPRATTAWRMRTKYDPTGLCWFGACNRNRRLARDAIINHRQPAVVGTGWLKHYPLAYGYAWRSKRTCFLFFCSTKYSRWFYVNNGWYGNNNGWVDADVWFAGTYYDNR
ncbi:MAG: hypothetical protein ACE5LU_06515 [Anaerolineae bacterium]